MNQHLNALGWCAHFENQLQSEDQSCIAGRIIEVQRELALLSDGQNEFWCGISGRMRFDAMNADAFPAVGDWALVRINAGDERGVIVHLLDRKSCFARKAPQTGAVQVVAANIDVAFITAALDVDFNLRRIERYLTLVWESGARPVVVLSKSDKCADLDAAIASVEAVAPGVRIIATSALSDAGIDMLKTQIRPGQSAVFIGSSGVGKSTLVNALMGRDVQETSSLSEFKDKGRHTTTVRRMLRLPNGGLIIDTPGMRELGLFDASDGVAQTFADVEAIVASCRFSDCQHRTEPGCGVKRALDNGSLDRERWQSYQKLQKEAAYQARQDDPNLMRAERERWKKIGQIGRSNARWLWD